MASEINVSEETLSWLDKVLKRTRNGIYVHQAMSATPVRVGDVVLDAGEKWEVFHVKITEDNWYYWHGEKYIPKPIDEACSEEYLESLE